MAVTHRPIEITFNDHSYSTKSIRFVPPRSYLPSNVCLSRRCIVSTLQDFLREYSRLMRKDPKKKVETTTSLRRRRK